MTQHKNSFNHLSEDDYQDLTCRLVQGRATTMEASDIALCMIGHASETALKTFRSCDDPCTWDDVDQMYEDLNNSLTYLKQCHAYFQHYPVVQAVIGLQTHVVNRLSSHACALAADSVAKSYKQDEKTGQVIPFVKRGDE